MSNVEAITSLLPLPSDIAGVMRSDDPIAAMNLPDGMFSPDVEISFIAPTGPRLDYRGADGLVEGWRDWLEPWETFTFDITEAAIDGGDKVVSVVRMGGRTKHGGVELDQEAAAVWTFDEDGVVTAVHFYLEREAALREAGLD